MLDPRKIGPRHYYDYLPKLGHACGDIWRDLPSLGVLGNKSLTGIIVSPACDLSQRKTETVTFLPIIPVVAYFSTIGALPLIRQRIKGLLIAGKCEVPPDWAGEQFTPPSTIDAVAASERISAHISKKQRSAKELAALTGALAGLRIIQLISLHCVAEPAPTDLALLFGAEWAKMKTSIIRNSFSLELHFLPGDKQEIAFSSIPSHSVVLIRYPLSIPIGVLDLAANTDPNFWQASVLRESARIPAVALTKDVMPIKGLSLRSEFLADLLSRYLATYSRLGSPDFTPATIGRFSDELDAQ